MKIQFMNEAPAKCGEVHSYSYPKINLALDILRKDISGYHEIRTVFHQLSEPFDEIILQEAPFDTLEVECDNPKVPIDITNTVLKAAFLLKEHTQIKKGVRIFIKKRIPLMSGLGGGASNAVAALKGLAELWMVKCCKKSVMIRAFDPAQAMEPHHDTACLLHRIADQIGMDCNFFLDGGTALGEHFGEKITSLPPLPSNIHFEIIETGVEISSHLAYQQIDFKKCGRNVEKTKRLIELLRANPAMAGFALFHNDFEEFVFEKYPELLEKKRRLELQKRGRVLLCGSGGCMVNIFYS